MTEELRIPLAVMSAHYTVLCDLQAQVTHAYESGGISPREATAALTTIIQETNIVIEEWTAQMTEWSRFEPLNAS